VGRGRVGRGGVGGENSKSNNYILLYRHLAGPRLHFASVNAATKRKILAALHEAIKLAIYRQDNPLRVHVFKPLSNSFLLQILWSW
jgi:hypothetical protein